MWILWIMRLWNCEFCEKWDFEIVIFIECIVVRFVEVICQFVQINMTSGNSPKRILLQQ